MKIYKAPWKTKIAYVVLGIFFSFIFLNGLSFHLTYHKDRNVAYMCIFILMMAIWRVFDIRIMCEENCITIAGDLRYPVKTRTIYWNDIEHVYSKPTFILPIDERLVLKAPGSDSDKMMSIHITDFSLELLKDILIKLPQNTYVDLHPWLKKRFIKEHGEELIRKFDAVK